MQQVVANLERENAVLAAQSGSSASSSSSFVSRLLATVAGLHNQPLYSDLTIITPSCNLHSHKFVLSCRSDTWGVPSLSEVESLDWSSLEEGVATTLLSWVYTDQLHLAGGKEGDRFTLALMAAASKFQLTPLVERCEQGLMSSVSVSNCISFYATAHTIGAEKLASHCSSLISANWSQFQPEDFETLSAELVFTMLQERASYPLHSAIRLRREDVVFLYLVKFHSQLEQRLNEPESEGRLPLDLALELGEEGIADSLVEHGVNVSRVTDGGETMLHLAIRRSDAKAARFLLKNGVDCDVAGGEGTALHLLAKKVDDEESPEVAKQVIDRGANLNIPNRDGETAVMVAIRRKNRSVLELLLGAKANLEVTNGEGKNALWLALQSDDKHDDSDSIASLIIAAGADPSSLCNSDGDSLLHSLASVGKEEAGLYLVSVGANVNLVNMRGETVLHLAAHQGLATLATALLVAGAEPNLQTQSNAGEVWRQSALHLALAAGQETVVTCLLEFSQVFKFLERP